MLTQVLIALFGVLGLFLAMSRWKRHRYWAPFVGMMAQPFWLYETWGKWGMFSVCILYTLAWGKGIYENVRGDGKAKARSS